MRLAAPRTHKRFDKTKEPPRMCRSSPIRSFEKKRRFNRPRSLAGIACDLATAIGRHPADGLALQLGVHERRATVGLFAFGGLVVANRLGLTEADRPQALA